MKCGSSLIAALYEAEGPRLRRRLLRRGLSAETAADLAQETFLRLLRAPLEEIRDPAAYLRRMADNVFMDHCRAEKRARTAVVPGAPPDERIPDPRLSAEAALIEGEAGAALDRALAELPPRCREVLRMHKFEGLSYVEISERLGISRNTVMVHMVKGLGALRRRLQDPEEGA